MKRIFLFLLTNLLVVFTIGILISVLGLDRWASESGVQYGPLMVFCFLYGMGGAFISLLISRWSAKMMMGVELLEPGRAGEFEWLVAMVHDHARRAGISTMPEVGVYRSGEVNAFATGPSRNRSLVAVSTGLLARMNRDEVEGVVGHEMSHISNGDMVTMTLVQGVVNAFVMFLARIIAFAVTQNMKEENRYVMRAVITLALQMVLCILGMLVVNAFSRYREFRADAGGARLAGRSDMVAALKALQRQFQPAAEAHASIAALKISGKSTGIARLFATHPPLEERIARLQGA